MEPFIKKQMLERLLKCNKDWTDGDLERIRQNQKTVDLVNHNEKIAIEIKDVNYSLMYGHDDHIQKLNGVLLDGLKDASKKFRNYPSYKTCLFFLIPWLDNLDQVMYSLFGSLVFIKKEGTGSLIENGRTKKYSDWIWRNIGCIVFYKGEDTVLFIENNLLIELERRISKKEASEMFILNFSE